MIGALVQKCDMLEYLSQLLFSIKKKKKLNGFVVDRQRKETSHYWTPQILCFYRNYLPLQEKKHSYLLLARFFLCLLNCAEIF